MVPPSAFDDDAPLPPARHTAASTAWVLVFIDGVLGLSASLLVMAVALTAYRGGEQWSWYATWALPLYCSLELATLASYRALTPTAAVWDLSLFLLALVALVVEYRCFFPRQEQARAASDAPA